ncbi:MAG: hypothetical protein JOZ08_13135 [Verrucomicrobia bacterium]|nr:hypothetical protein [Verrucomicrobiota bacterium]
MCSKPATPSISAPIIRLLRELPEPPPRPRLSSDEWRGAVDVFGLVFTSTLPVVLPFLLVSNITLALRISNLVAVGLLFLTGYLFGLHTRHNPWRWGGHRISGFLTNVKTHLERHKKA